jgi:leucyl aminopeptidase
MQIEVIAKPAEAADVIVVFAAEGKKLLGLGAALAKGLQKAMAAPAFSAKRGEIIDVLGYADTRRVVVVGVGNPKELSAIRARKLGGKIAAHLLQAHEPKAEILAGGGFGKLDDAVFLGNIALGAKLRAYRFGKYLTQAKPGEAPAEIVALSLVTPQRAAAQKIVADAEALAAGICFARDQVNEPPSTLWPDSFAKRLLELKKHGVAVEIYDEAALRKMGAGGILAVAQGSQHPPRLVVLRWNGKGGKSKEGPVALVGKGVCFDTGGISLKPPPGMWDMKWDMGGAGVVTGVMQTLAKRKARVNVVGLCGLVENMPDGNAQRPGDVVTSMSGQTIEVQNTDAEGRLVLADVLWYAQQRFKPRAIVDLATLTGAIIAALSDHYAGLFANNDELADKLTAAGKTVGERLWRLPMGDEYDRDLKSMIADMKNIGGARAGSITAAQFLQRFVKKDVPWAHLDIAGVVWSEKGTPLSAPGSTSYGVRLLNRFIADNYEN